MDISFNGKDAKNPSDYRKSLLIVAKWFSDNLPEHFFNKILLSMCNIQTINYYSKKKNSLQSILKLYPIEKLQTNTIISFQIIKSYPKDYQSFLENIADFLLNTNIWWKEVEDYVSGYASIHHS